MKGKIIVCDIDGTIAKLGDRLNLIKQKAKDYDTFFARCIEDEPIQDVIEIVKTILYSDPCVGIVFCTGRKEVIRRETEMWIKEYVGLEKGEYSLLMRPNNDNRPDTEYKPDILERYDVTPDNTLCVFEDRASVVYKLREIGFRVLHVDNGEF